MRGLGQGCRLEGLSGSVIYIENLQALEVEVRAFHDSNISLDTNEN